MKNEEIRKLLGGYATNTLTKASAELSLKPLSTTRNCSTLYRTSRL